MASQTQNWRKVGGGGDGSDAIVTIKCGPPRSANAHRRNARGRQQGGRRRWTPSKHTVTQHFIRAVNARKEKPAGRDGWKTVGNAKPAAVRRLSKSAVRTANRFSALGDDAAKDVPRVAKPIAPTGAWAKPIAMDATPAKRPSLLEIVRPKLVSLKKQVTFKGDSENLMTPPCDVMVFKKDDAPLTISDPSYAPPDLASAKTSSWTPSTPPMTAHERQTILDELARLAPLLDDLEKNGTWADGEEIDELTEKIAELQAKLA